MNLLLEFTIHDVREDLKLPVRMGAEPSLWVNAVLVNNPQRAELLVPRVVVASSRSVESSCWSNAPRDVPREAECVEGLEPTVVSVAALFAATRDNLHCNGY